MDLQAAADRLGVHYQTVYRWVRDGSLPAVKIANIYDVTDADLVAFQTRRSSPTPPRSTRSVRDWDGIADRLFQAIIAGNEAEAVRIVTKLAKDGVPTVQLCEQLLAPVLLRVGEGWVAGHISISQEHRASTISERLIASVTTIPPGRPRGVVAVATAHGDTHTIPAAMATAALRADHWTVHHLGINLPTEELLSFALHENVDLVVLTVVNPDCIDAADEAAARLTASGVRVLVGVPGGSLAGLLTEAQTARALPKAL